MIDPSAPCERGAIAASLSARSVPVIYWPVLGLVVGPGVVLGVGLVVLGVSVPVPPAAPELIPDELPPDSEGMLEEPELELPPIELPESELPPDDLPPEELLSDGMLELPLLPDEAEPDLPPEPPIMPEHATISIAQATDIIHLVIDHSR